MAFLRILNGAEKGRRFQIDRDELVVGRLPSNVVCLDDPSVSGQHCSIVRKGRRFTLKDLDSTNGTRLNGVRIESYRLSAKDTITAGSVDILFDGDDIDDHVDDAIPPTIIRPAPEPPEAQPADPSPFSQRRSSKGVWLGLSITVGLLVLGALTWFVYSLLQSD